MNEMFESAVVIGKFDPFHRGHAYLIRTAERRSRRVNVIVCGRSGDFIAADRRAAWIRTSHPAANVAVVDQDELELGDDDSDGWARATVRLLGAAPEAVFTSEEYGDRYADCLGSVHVLVDRERTVVPISASRIRADPLTHLRFLEPHVRAHFVLRVCLLGAESTGKTTLAAALADAFETVWVPEYGHLYQALGRADPYGDWASDEFVAIARMQRGLENLQATQANRVLFCDTDVFTTGLWHEAFLGEPPPVEVRRLADDSHYALFLLCDDDIPFRQDAYNLRQDGPRRVWMQSRYRERLEADTTPWVILSGCLERRLAEASGAIEALIRAPRSHSTSAIAVQSP